MHFHVSNNFTVHVAPGSDKTWEAHVFGNAGMGFACSANDCYACSCAWQRRATPVPDNKRAGIEGPPCTECKSGNKHCECDNADSCKGLQITFNKTSDNSLYCLSCAVKHGMQIAACRCP